MDVKGICHSTDESAGDACEDGDKRTLLAKKLEARQSWLMCTKTSYRSRVVVITPTTRKSHRTTMNASLTVSKKVYEYTKDRRMAAAATDG